MRARHACVTAKLAEGIFIFGGYLNDESETWAPDGAVYDSVRNAWRAAPTCPTALHPPVWAFAFGSKVILVGRAQERSANVGQIVGPPKLGPAQGPQAAPQESNFAVFNTRSGRWEATARVPRTLEPIARLYPCTDAILVVRHDGRTCRWKPEADSVDTGPPAPFGRDWLDRQAGYAATKRGLVLVLHTDVGLDSWLLPASGSWQRIPDVPLSVWRGATVAGSGTSVLVWGGLQGPMVCEPFRAVEHVFLNDGALLMLDGYPR